MRLWKNTAGILCAGLSFVALVAAAQGAAAESGRKAFERECSDCHMAFPAQLMPKRSWHLITSTLDNHFGEDASLDPDVTKKIQAYLEANAADTGGRTRGALRGIKDSETPVRITEMPWWVGIHKYEVRPSAFKDPRVRSKSNCMACHRGAKRGNYDDD
ncbi:diheme cytochrome c [Profundibacter sp.]|uniref:diheme cytochrome c n=1 Tax=Profundibacter sp. TaxID=3101071 RepID=UPI003D12E273